MADYFPIESPSDECSQGLAERAWQGHVDAGRIGSRSAPDQARLEKLAADEMALFGEVRSLRRDWPEEPRGWW